MQPRFSALSLLLKDKELARLIGPYRSALWTVLALSVVLNILLLTGSIYLMLVYDSVLPSHNLATLAGLLLMVALVYGFQGMLDTMRARIMGDIANALERPLSARVQQAMFRSSLSSAAGTGDPLQPMRDLDHVRSFLGGSGPMTLLDLPWVVFFLLILSLLHVYLGLTALLGAIALFGLTLFTDRATRDPVRTLADVTGQRQALAADNVRHAELLASMGMRGAMLERWAGINRQFQWAQTRLFETTGALGGVSKTGRMFLQSLLLSVGAVLVIRGEASGGAIFASSVLGSRALAPVDQLIGNWRSFISAQQGWFRLTELLFRFPAENGNSTILPPPVREVQAEQLVIVPPGSQTLAAHGVDFRLAAGSAMGVIGPSAAGKSSFVRALIGLWPPARGCVRLDGAALDQWDRDRLGRHIGYLPQTVELLEGSVAENIARFNPAAPSEAVVAAAMAAGCHDMIVRLPRGYETGIGRDGISLSAGQRQRIALARALFGDPFLVVLDEPNSNLDAEGEAALEAAIASIRQRNGIAVVVSHRPSILAGVDRVMFMRHGRMEGFGPRDEILARFVSGQAAPVAINGGRPVQAARAEG